MKAQIFLVALFLVIVGGGFIAVANRAERAEAETAAIKSTLEAMQPTATNIPVEFATSTPMPQPTMTPTLTNWGYCQGTMYRNTPFWERKNGDFYQLPENLYRGQVVNVLDWRANNVQDYVLIQTQSNQGYVFFLDLDLRDCYPSATATPVSTWEPNACVTPKSSDYRMMYERADKVGRNWFVTPGVIYGVYSYGEMMNVFSLEGSTSGWILENDITFVTCPSH